MKLNGRCSWSAWNALTTYPLMGVVHAMAVSRYAIGAKRILEYGAGGSTVWLAQIAPRAIIHSIEPRSLWRDRVIALHRALQGCGVRIASAVAVYSSAELLPSSEPYDLVFVDGPEPRHLQLEAAYDRVRAGGVIILHDSEVRHYAPAMHTCLAKGMRLIEETADPTWSIASNARLWIAEKVNDDSRSLHDRQERSRTSG